MKAMMPEVLTLTVQCGFVEAGDKMSICIPVDGMRMACVAALADPRSLNRPKLLVLECTRDHEAEAAARAEMETITNTERKSDEQPQLRIHKPEDPEE